MDMLIVDGGEVKALPNGKVGGYLVRFTDAENPDTSQYRDFFTPETDFGVEWSEENGVKSAPVYFNHGMDEQLGKRRLASGTLKMDDVGVWIEAKLKERDEWEKAVGYMARKQKLGWSSGAASHLVEREPVKNRQGETIAHRITCWPIAEGSLTHTPAEPTNDALAVKSLSEWQAESLAEEDLPPQTHGGNLCAGKSLGTGLSLADHSSAVVSANEGYAERLETRLEARIKSGRVLSAVNLADLQRVLASLNEVRGNLTALLGRAGITEETEEADTQEEAEAAPVRDGNQLYREFLQTEALLNGVPA